MAKWITKGKKMQVEYLKEKLAGRLPSRQVFDKWSKLGTQLLLAKLMLPGRSEYHRVVLEDPDVMQTPWLPHTIDLSQTLGVNAKVMFEVVVAKLNRTWFDKELWESTEWYWNRDAQRVHSHDGILSVVGQSVMLVRKFQSTGMADFQLSRCPLISIGSDEVQVLGVVFQTLKDRDELKKAKLKQGPLPPNKPIPRLSSKRSDAFIPASVSKNGVSALCQECNLDTITTEKIIACAASVEVLKLKLKILLKKEFIVWRQKQ